MNIYIFKTIGITRRRSGDTFSLIPSDWGVGSTPTGMSVRIRSRVLILEGWIILEWVRMIPRNAISRSFRAWPFARLKINWRAPRLGWERERLLEVPPLQSWHAYNLNSHILRTFLSTSECQLHQRFFAAGWCMNDALLNVEEARFPPVNRNEVPKLWQANLGLAVA